jgi:hypothetical protein
MFSISHSEQTILFTIKTEHANWHLNVINLIDL